MTKNPAAIWRKSKNLNSQLGKTGRVITFTTIYSAPATFEHQVPYHVGIIEFDDATRISAEIVDCSKESLKIGLKIKTVIRRLGQSEPEQLIEYGLKVKPLK